MTQVRIIEVITEPTIVLQELLTLNQVTITLIQETLVQLMSLIGAAASVEYNLMQHKTAIHNLRGKVPLNE